MSARAVCAGLGVLATAVAATLAPLWTYSISLALFGLPHVAIELRYVDERFGARLGSRLARRLAAPLLGIAVVRALALGGVGDAATRAAAEWTLGAALVGLVLPMLAAHGLRVAALGMVALALAVTALIVEPFAALVIFALLHNLTPLGFLAERLTGRERRRALVAGALVFVAIPLAIVCGAAPFHADTAALEPHLSAFVPGIWRHHAFALDLFRAGAFLQCMHYAVVIHVLPRLGGGGEESRSLLRWPSSRRFLLVVGAGSAVLLASFIESFAGARATYGVFAALHAWVEIPVLLLACASAGTRA